MSQAAKKKCLKDINQEVIEAGNALKTIAEFPENLQCLQTFVECHDFRAWLVAAFKGTTTNCNQWLLPLFVIKHKNTTHSTDAGCKCMIVISMQCANVKSRSNSSNKANT